MYKEKTVHGAERDNCIDVLKGIAIVLMVLGHSGIGEEITRFIYLFHMAAFVIASGYCYNEKYSKGELTSFIKRRIRSLYLPYVAYMLVLVFLHNTCITLNIYTDSVQFLEGSYGNEYGLESLYTFPRLMIESVKSFFLLGSEQLFGAAWFIRVLFYMSLLWCIIDNCLVRFCRNGLTQARVLFSLLFLVLGCVMTNYNILNFSNIPAIFTAYVLFVFGFLKKKIVDKHGLDISIRQEMLVLVISCIVLIVIFATGVNINMAVFDSAFLYLMASIAGWSMLYAFARLLLHMRAKWIISCLCYLGRNTMPIVLLHFVAFKVVTLIEIAVYHLPLMRLASFPIYRGYPGWWILYVLSGIVVPICLAKIWRIIMSRLYGRFIERSHP